MSQLALFRSLPEVSPASEWDQRWAQGRPSWQHARWGPAFDPDAYTVEALPEHTARAYIVANHYSGSYPAALRRYGLFRGRRLVGVAVLGVPTSARTLTNVFPDCEPYCESAVLARFVLADQVAANGESWFLARVFHDAAANGLRWIMTVADPVPHRIGDVVLFPGHIGTIYQATNAVFTGRSCPRVLTLLPNGRCSTRGPSPRSAARSGGTRRSSAACAPEGPLRLALASAAGSGWSRPSTRSARLVCATAGTTATPGPSATGPGADAASSPPRRSRIPRAWTTSGVNPRSGHQRGG